MPTTTRQVGLLHTGSKNVFGGLVNLAINTANAWLQANGHTDINVALKASRTHYANDDLDQLEDAADDLVADQTDIILAAGGPQSAIAARDATADAQPDVAQRISVVFTTVVDPVDLGLRNSCGVPGGTNLTGMAGQTSENDPTRLCILRQFLVAQGRVGTVYGVLVNPSRQKNRQQYSALKQAAADLGISLVRRRANNLRGIKRAYEFFRGANVAGVVVTADSFFNNNRQKIVAEAAPDPTDNRPGVPSIYQWREFTDNFTDNDVSVNGGLISFGPSMREAYEKAGEYVGKIATKESPSNIPCSTPDEGEMKVWVNDRTAVAHQLNPVNIPGQLCDWPVIRRP